MLYSFTSTWIRGMLRSADVYKRQAHNVASYPMRHCTTDANGNSNYYRFTITRAGRSYRAYLDSAPRFNRSWEELGLKKDNNRYYIDAGRN